MATLLNKIEFDLTIRKYGEKRSSRTMYDPYPMKEDKEPELEVQEELKFKSLSVVEVMRKLLDYIRDY